MRKTTLRLQSWLTTPQSLNQEKERNLRYGVIQTRLAIGFRTINDNIFSFRRLMLPNVRLLTLAYIIKPN